MAYFERHFTVEEAQAMIPWVRGVFAKLHLVIRGSGQDATAQRKPESPESLGPPASLTDSPEQIIDTLSLNERKTLAQGLIDGLRTKGIVIQDIERGLIDFPSWRDAREVLLCYELADGDALSHWHELDAGFAGRTPILPEEFES